MSGRALFLDRDGVVNHEVGYLHRIEDVRWVDGIFSLARTAAELGYRIIVVTNQSGIGRGLYTEAQFHTLMDWMRAEFAAKGARLDAVYFCPFHPREGIGAYQREHEDRKPGPGMLLRGARDLGVDLSRSLMVGDRCSDVAAANAAGVPQMFLLPGTEEAGCAGRFTAVDSLAAVERWMREQG
ncbi:HAD family hydrolase [Granulicella cerasi]|uniref:D,D-heptose 1,7-bisphosphate phosphatase n=1 Tax=Granulicella cerasi TaxID=741063 RepID=A0ABW1ZAT3_9BACT|nr:HAD family hydrolase [Granulicella cerasi]